MASITPRNRPSDHSETSSRSPSIATEQKIDESTASHRNKGSADFRGFDDQTDKSASDSHAGPLQDRQFEAVHCSSWKDAANWNCHASFGDEKTTATVGAFGQLLHFSGFLGVGSSGMFSADHSAVTEPCLTSFRNLNLQNLSDQSFHFGPTELGDHYGLKFPGLTLTPDARPDLQWTFWRWPRHVYPAGSFVEEPNLKLTIQWMVQDNTVLQQCLLESIHDDEIRVDMIFHKSMLIRDLDHLDWRYKFNEERNEERNGERNDNYDIRLGPEGHSCVFVHKLNKEPPTESPTASSPLRHSNTAGIEDSQAHAGILASYVQSSSEGVQQDAFTGSSVQNSRQEGGSEPRRPFQEDTPSHNSSSSTHSRTNEIRPHNPSPQDHEAHKNSHDISVISSVTIDGQFQIFEDKKDRASPQKWSVSVKGQQAPGLDGQPWSHEVTTAYEMKILDDLEADRQAYLIPLHKMNVSQFLRDQQRAASPMPLYVPIPDRNRPDKHNEGDEAARTRMQHFPLDQASDKMGTVSPEKNLGFAARRNLEHILSACTIQATPKPYGSKVASPLPEELRHVKAVALTCGDMSGHRICWSASFFAFRFLVESHKILRRVPKEQNTSILGRIKKACLGHLKWLHLSQEQNGQRFGDSYWVNGKLTVEPDFSSSRMPVNSLLDTGFQILKVAACTDLFTSKDTPAELMSEWALSWLDSMERSDRRQKYAWPHAEDEGVNKFRLDDHVWIWRALKSLESHDGKVWTLMSQKSSESLTTQLSEGDIGRLRKTFAPDTVQREVIKRFTTENDVFQKRMLALTRSARKTRFLLHSRDTALFYNEMLDFLGKDTSIQDLWQNTINCQMFHDGYQESHWENPLRYALCIMMGTQGHSINCRQPEEMVQKATDVLFSSCSLNGFFPGGLELLTKKPVPMWSLGQEDMNFYYHASFEIPYILLTRADYVSDVYKRLASPKAEATRPQPDGKAGLGGYISLEGSRSTEQIPQARRNSNLLSEEPNQVETLLSLSKLLLSRSTTLYLDAHDVAGNFKQAATPQRLTMKKAMPFNNLINSSSIVKVEDEWLFKYPEFFMRETPVDRVASERDLRPELDFCIIDIPSKKLIEGKQTDRRPRTMRENQNDELYKLLRQTRTARDSKKRLIHFHRATENVVTTCCDAAEASEIDNLRDFFLRHADYDKYAMDQCTMVHNTWETELHLSYFQILEGPQKPLPGIPSIDSKPFPGGREMQIVRASVSFRFQGDFFDRFWTCYMLEHSHKGEVSDYYLLEQKENRQRKVLEERYFFNILVNLMQSTGEILDEVKVCLGFKSGMFSSSIHTTNAYSSWSDLWQKFEPLIQELDDDLSSTRVTVDQWEAREEERGEEKPRWTNNDEKKYRASITRIRREIKHERRKLKDLHSHIRTFRETCSNRLVKAREELSFRSEQNIAMFTYVTVVFLPLGFTASLFSMSGSPERSLVINMVVASIIALAVTVVTLMNAKALASVMEMLSNRFKYITDRARESSVMAENQKLQENNDMTFADGEHESIHLDKSSKDASSWNLIFWISFVFVEVPAKSVVIAYHSLAWPWHNNKDLKSSIESERTESVAAESPRISKLRLIISKLANYISMLSLVLGIYLNIQQRTIEVLQKRAGKKSQMKKVAPVLLAIFILPVFLTAWILKTLYFIFLDLMVYFGEHLVKWLKKSLPEVDQTDRKLILSLTKSRRPVRAVKDYLWPPERENEPKLPDAP